MHDLKDKNALVCGSTQGIGLASAKELAARGAAVTLVARNPEALKEAQSQLSTDAGQSHSVVCADFTDAPGLQKKAARGKALPPGWQKKIAPGQSLDYQVYRQGESLPDVLLQRLPPLMGSEILQVEDKIILLNTATRTILDSFDLTPTR